MFKYFDIYDKGCVDFPEFMRTLEKIGLYYQPSDVQPLFDQVYDVDKSGTLDYKEFSSIVFGNRDSGQLKGQQIKRSPDYNV
jgi:Ca2+-binding EF-hand superfamily protein